MADKEKMLDLKTDGDPAEFLLSNPKYQDCHLTVGIPDTGDVEKIGVSSCQLIAHSSVFRDMLADSPLADPSGDNTHIKDVSPATFKLMLRVGQCDVAPAPRLSSHPRASLTGGVPGGVWSHPPRPTVYRLHYRPPVEPGHVYGGKLPKLTPDEAAELALCADKYNIQQLVEKAAKHLKPSTAEGIFPTLVCAAYINCSDLELQASKIVQQQTDKICQNQIFFQLNEDCLLFIVKQSTLNITELELWDNIVRWGENQVKTRPDKSLRDCLNKVLQHVRLLSLSSNEIVEHVLPKKVLTPEEFVDLTLAVSKKGTLQSPGLCKIQEKREIYIGTDKKALLDKKKEMGPFIFNVPPAGSSCYLTQPECKQFSTVTIKPIVNVEINTLTLKGMKIKPTNDQSFKSYALSCCILIYKSSNGFLMQTETVTVKGTAVPNEDIVLQVKTDDNRPLVLEANQTCNLIIDISPPLVVHSACYGNTTPQTSTFSGKHFTIIFEDPFHISKIGYTAK